MHFVDLSGQSDKLEDNKTELDSEISPTCKEVYPPLRLFYIFLLLLYFLVWA